MKKTLEGHIQEEIDSLKEEMDVLQNTMFGKDEYIV